MKPVKPAEFAWPGGDRPSAIDFRHAVSAGPRAAILEALSRDFVPARDSRADLLALTPEAGDSVAGRYRLMADRQSWFVRVSSRLGHPDIERALLECLELASITGVNGLLISGARLSWKGDDYRVDVRPFVAGRHTNYSREDTAALAALLGQCHRALRNFSGGTQVRGIAAERYERLDEARDAIAQAVGTGDYAIFGSNAKWARQNRDWLRELAISYTPRFDQLPDAQCLHGEVHSGNVIFRAEGDEPVLVDFEESVHVFAPPAWDLAWLLQRFCLFDNPARDTVCERLGVIIEHYGSKPAGLASMMRQIAWFSVAVIVDLYTRENVESPQTECEKFMRLERQAAALVNVL